MDETLLLLINGHHNEYWDEFMWMLTYRFTWIPLYIAIAYAAMKASGWRRGLMFIVAVALTTLIADQVCSHVIRPLAERLRPSNVENPLSAMIHIVHEYRGGAYGMPSCHAANTMGLLAMVWWQFRNRWLTAVMTVWMLGQVYSRMYLGVHYPTDLLVGAMVGAGAAACVMLLEGRLCRTRHSGNEATATERRLRRTRHSGNEATAMEGRLCRTRHSGNEATAMEGRLRRTRHNGNEATGYAAMPMVVMAITIGTIALMAL